MPKGVFCTVAFFPRLESPHHCQRADRQHPCRTPGRHLGRLTTYVCCVYCLCESAGLDRPRGDTNSHTTKPALTDAGGTCAAKHDDVQEAVGAQAVGAVHAGAGRLAGRKQPRHDRVWVAIPWVDDLAVVVGGDAPHVVVHSGQHRDGLLQQDGVQQDATTQIQTETGTHSIRKETIQTHTHTEIQVHTEAERGAQARRVNRWR